MEDILREKLQETKTPNTVKQYLIIYKKINKAIDPEDETVSFLYNVQEVLDFLDSHYSANSKRTHLGYINGILKTLKSVVEDQDLHIDALNQYKRAINQTR